MTLKQGRQQDYFMDVLTKNFPELVDKYRTLYKYNMRYGQPLEEYHQKTSKHFAQIATKYRIPKRIPPGIFKQVLTKTDQIIVILEHLDYLLRLKGTKNPFGYAAYSISKQAKPIEEIDLESAKIKGVGAATKKIIQEILSTGTSRQYDRLL
jgi:hypothetical protein